jgi:hypothetical protein
MKKSIFEVIGWYGVIAILIGYLLLSFGLLLPGDVIYQLLNFTGAIAIVFHSLYKKDYEPVVLDSIWALIALIALINILRIS